MSVNIPTNKQQVLIWNVCAICYSGTPSLHLTSETLRQKQGFLVDQCLYPLPLIACAFNWISILEYSKYCLLIYLQTILFQNSIQLTLVCNLFFLWMEGLKMLTSNLAYKALNKIKWNIYSKINNEACLAETHNIWINYPYHAAFLNQYNKSIYLLKKIKPYVKKTTEY